MKPRPAIPTVLVLLATLTTVAAADQSPRPVSPGDGESARLIAQRCPTFNWSGPTGAQAYELVVYRVPAREDGEAEPVIHETLPGAAAGWTPSLDRCLEAGGSYAWSLRAHTAAGTSEWSPPSLFAVAGRRAATPPVGLGRPSPPRRPAPAARGAASPAAAGVGRSAEALLPTPDATGITSEPAPTSGLTVGVHGVTQSSGDGSAGVVGEATASSGETSGVAGLVGHADGVGVFAQNAATSGFAVALEAQTASAGGVAGSFNNTAGGKILSAAVGGSEKFSVDGSGNVSFEGVLNGVGAGQSSVNGNFSVGGTLTKGGGSFRIDHPLDPANKTLSHSFVESPDMKNVYDGLVTLGADGSAWVELPEYFERLNDGYRYQLTALGAAMPSLHVAEEIAGNRFRIAGGPPRGRVSWQVTGIRQDAFARAHRIRVEEDKPAWARGTYLHPELFATAEPEGEALARREADGEANGGR